MKRILCIALAALTAAFAGCAGGGGETSSAVGPEDGRTVVSMMFTADLSTFEALVERTYPDIDLQVERNAEATIDGESERRLHNGHGTDIVTTTMPTGDVHNYVVDLSAEPYVDRYQTSTFQNVADDGKTLFIPLPGQYYGYVYNATLLEQGGIPVPASRPELLDMMDAAAAQGLGSGEDGMLFGVSSTMSTVSTWLVATQVPDFLSTAEGIIWNQKLRDGEASFSDGMAGCLDVLGPMVQRGYLNIQALNPNLNAKSPISYAGNAIPIEKRMLDGSLLMVYGTTRLVTFLNQNSEAYEFAMLPLMSSKGNHPWTITVPDAYLSINAALARPGQEKTLDACSRVLDLLSTPEGQDAYLADCGTARSYLSSYTVGQGDIPEGLRGCIEEGYIYNIQLPARLLSYFGRQMIAVLNGGLSMDEALAAVDDYYRNGDPETDYDQTLVGLMAEDLIYGNYNVRLEETALGNLVADAVRELTGTQLAVVNGGSIRGSLYAGNVFGADLDTVCPYQNQLVTVEVSGATIRAMLENGISAMDQISDIPGGRFLNVSGLRYSFQAPGEDSPARLLGVTLSDGAPLEDSKYYSLTISNYMAGAYGYRDNNGDGYTMLNLYSEDIPKAEDIHLLEETGLTYSDALQDYFTNHSGEAITSRCEGRIKVVSADG